MDAVGLLIGISGLVGLLIKTSLRGYKVFSNIRELDEDFRHYHNLFCLEEQSLKDWGKRLAEFTDGRQLEEVLGSENDRYKLIIRTAAEIAQLFANIDSMENAYGVRIEEQPTSLAGPSTPTLLLTPEGSDQERGRRKSFSFRQHFRSAWSRSPSRTDAISTNKMVVKGTPPADSLSPHPVPFHAVISDATIIEQIETLAAGFETKISSYQQCKWAVSDKEKFGTLVRKLKEYNEGLSRITQPLFLSPGMYAPLSSQSYQGLFEK
jgi:hypothetical protein